ncbi:hypothetical protein H4R34_002964 [Dimargaris verticillata]|uniref:ditrans,polycis-polyprenyl diphosphate synthase [(2E,6E)-farnesyldiphosphate specific] n=1 Tax=Dimargaris verticillata TaxID=2761393 RepID=A0A9W8ED28_9FUNG|nr:hypothetical protein H4R34_002964 [Dimargaris verticillata]
MALLHGLLRHRFFHPVWSGTLAADPPAWERTTAMTLRYVYTFLLVLFQAVYLIAKSFRRATVRVKDRLEYLLFSRRRARPFRSKAYQRMVEQHFAPSESRTRILLDQLWKTNIQPHGFTAIHQELADLPKKPQHWCVALPAAFPRAQLHLTQKRHQPLDITRTASHDNAANDRSRNDTKLLPQQGALEGHEISINRDPKAMRQLILTVCRIIFWSLAAELPCVSIFQPEWYLGQHQSDGGSQETQATACSDQPTPSCFHVPSAGDTLVSLEDLLHALSLVLLIVETAMQGDAKVASHSSAPLNTAATATNDEAEPTAQGSGSPSIRLVRLSTAATKPTRRIMLHCQGKVYTIYPYDRVVSSITVVASSPDDVADANPLSTAGPESDPGRHSADSTLPSNEAEAPAPTKNHEPHAKPNLDNEPVLHHDGHHGHNHAPFQDLEVHLLGVADGFGRMTAIAQQLVRTVNDDTMPLETVNVDYIAAQSQVSAKYPDPQLVLFTSRPFVIHAFPPWALRYAQVYHTSVYKQVTYPSFKRAMYKYANCQQRFGR